MQPGKEHSLSSLKSAAEREVRGTQHCWHHCNDYQHQYSCNFTTLQLFFMLTRHGDSTPQTLATHLSARQWADSNSEEAVCWSEEHFGDLNTALASFLA